MLVLHHRYVGVTQHSISSAVQVFRTGSSMGTGYYTGMAVILKLILSGIGMWYGKWYGTLFDFLGHYSL